MKRDIKKILIVDDEKNAVKLVEKFLPQDSYSFIEAFDGKEACRKAKEEHPSMIVLDMLMPGMDGYEVIEELKNNSRTADIPILILSAAQVDRGKISGKDKEGDIPVISKPFNPKHLEKNVENLLNRQG